MRIVNILIWASLIVGILSALTGLVGAGIDDPEVVLVSFNVMWLSLLTGWSVGRLFDGNAQNVSEGV